MYTACWLLKCTMYKACLKLDMYTVKCWQVRIPSFSNILCCSAALLASNSRVYRPLSRFYFSSCVGIFWTWFIFLEQGLSIQNFTCSSRIMEILIFLHFRFLLGLFVYFVLLILCQFYKLYRPCTCIVRLTVSMFTSLKLKTEECFFPKLKTLTLLKFYLKLQ